MAKEEGIKMEGVVEEALPGATFRVKLTNESLVLCHLAGKMKMNFIRVLPGDLVSIEMSPYDLTKGRITRRELKKGSPHATEDQKKDVKK